ncbi:tRNA (N6-threonylcarbamoyladenosine(37)-N6)-methyltransferase TrmO [Bermanella marisrubri]|uniref:TsaA-like domain-containing protein n=1 Tax=Bermanella marisrubri TaxID=207949 RepID=Q1N698_9GAMM|nr:tRNA (N6-threonylcarbamoyladenosine(37)-N6)-methyltransferase TrmO [Bermanella marisrubri]EAT13694.1 hypothetical protein RED65_09889 [Oceanobacter sp. RED65] [Bermanella marisrubri]QIZ84472.1 tRNA (N6-threonylcarbamoyladenosine(37)-N6)-methyltransferase TrmO [Bermanella marisrubri]
MKIELQPIGYINSPYHEKFATPRQPGLVSQAQGYVELVSPYNQADSVAGLETCSHIWIEFVFHEVMNQGWKPKVRPPRLGGNEKMGVFATRSTHRPNPIGLSVVKLDRIDINNGVRLWISGLDLIDGTPVVDIKPYVPYSDCLPDAQYPFAQDKPPAIDVIFSQACETRLNNQPQLKTFLLQVLEQDPRPAFHKFDQEREYGAALMQHNVKWRYQKDDSGNISLYVESITPLA